MPKYCPPYDPHSEFLRASYWYRLFIYHHIAFRIIGDRVACLICPNRAIDGIPTTMLPQHVHQHERTKKHLRHVTYHDSNIFQPLYTRPPKRPPAEWCNDLNEIPMDATFNTMDTAFDTMDLDTGDTTANPLDDEESSYLGDLCKLALFLVCDDIYRKFQTVLGSMTWLFRILFQRICQVKWDTVMMTTIASAMDRTAQRMLTSSRMGAMKPMRVVDCTTITLSTRRTDLNPTNLSILSLCRGRSLKSSRN